MTDIQHSELSEQDIKRQLNHMGYGIDLRAGWAFGLNVASKTRIRQYDGKPRREAIGSVKPLDMKLIRMTSRDVRHAAERVIDICRGVVSSAQEQETANQPADLSAMAAEIRELRAELASLRGERKATVSNGSTSEVTFAAKPTRKVRPRDDETRKFTLSKTKREKYRKILRGPEGQVWQPGRGRPPNWFMEGARMMEEADAADRARQEAAAAARSEHDDDSQGR